jgi:hypothetical protein
MKELVAEVLKWFGLSSGVATLLVVIFFTLSKIQPISMFTANIIEKRLFSKEKRLIISIIQYIFKSLIWSFILYTIATLMSLIDYSNFSKYIIFFISCFIIATELLLLLYLYLNDLKQNDERDGSKFYSKMIKLKNMSMQKRLIIFVIYVLSVNLSLGLLIGYSMSIIPLDKSIMYLLSTYVFTFIFSLFIPLLINPALKNINWDKGKKIAYIIDNTLNENWYILYPISKGYILLGDNKDEFSCTKQRILKLESLIDNETIYLE